MRVRAGKTRVRRALAPLAACAALTAVAAPAAADGFERCGSDGERTCLRLVVPLDRSGTVPGTVRLRIDRYRATRRAVRPPLLLLAGGPGQSAIGAFGPNPRFLGDDRVDLMVGAERRHRDLVIVDVRGTGRSGLLDCPGVQQGRVAATAPCAERLGPRRDHYASIDTAADLDAVRAALGAERIALLGVSYGTNVALTYARLHPTRVDRLVLDSPVGLAGVDGFQRSSMNALPRVAAGRCAAGACRSFTRDAGRDLRRLAARLERAPLRGRVTLPSGGRHPAQADGSDLIDLMAAADVDPFLAGTVPGAVRRAVQGDPASLLRAIRAAGAVHSSAGTPARELSATAYLATLCSEARLPWGVATPVAERMAAAAVAAAGQGTAAFAPFGARTAVRSDVLRSCASWPSSPRPVPALPAPPDVPALVLSGTRDVRTPTEDARAVATTMPGAILQVFPGVGHSVISGAPTMCPNRMVERFLAGRPVGRCRDRTGTLEEVVPPPPRSFEDIRGGGRQPRVRRTLRAVAWTFVDFTAAFYQRIGSSLGRPGGPRALRLGALRGGSYVFGARGVSMRRARVVDGVRVSGHIRFDDDGVSGLVLRVDGRRAASGRLETRGKRLVGRLGGTRLSVGDAGFVRLLGDDRAGARAAVAARLATRPQAPDLAWPSLRWPAP